jgi:hypothetical protein
MLTHASRQRGPWLIFDVRQKRHFPVLPTASDICPFIEDLDGKVALEHFHGKTLADVEILLRENSLYYLGDYLWMGPVAFRFYLPAVRSYLASETSDGDSDGVNSVLSTLELRYEQEPAEMNEARGEIRALLDVVIERYSSFAIAQEIYGDLRAKAASLRERVV